MPIYLIDKGSNKRLHSYRVIVSFTDSFGRYRKKEKIIHNALLKDANKLEAQMQLDINDYVNGTQKIRFNELVDMYLKHKKADDRDLTVQKIERTLNFNVKPYFQNMIISNITPKTLNEFKLYLNNCKSEKTGKPYSFIYKKNIMGYLRSVLNYAVRFCNLPNNPYNQIDPIRDKSLTIDSTRLRFWKLEQYQIFSKEVYQRATIKQTYDFWCLYVFFSLLFFCGLRKSEAYGLDWNHYDGKQIFIEYGISNKVKGYRYVKERPKNKSSIRYIPVCNQLKLILDEHKDRSRNVYGFTEQFYICGGIEPLRDSFVDSNKLKIIKHCGLDYIKVHEFRHSFASLLINQGVNIKVISKLMGHSTVEQTWNTYGHLYPEAENEAILKIDEITKISG